MAFLNFPLVPAFRKDSWEEKQATGHSTGILGFKNGRGREIWGVEKFSTCPQGNGLLMP